MLGILLNNINKLPDSTYLPKNQLYVTIFNPNREINIITSEPEKSKTILERISPLPSI